MGAMESPVAQTESPYEAARRLENLIRRGTVAAVQLTSPACLRVKVGDNTTDWLPWLALRAGGAQGGRHWCPPVVGEQAVVLCQGGDMTQGVALVGLYSDAMSGRKTTTCSGCAAPWKSCAWSPSRWTWDRASAACT